MTQVSLTPTHFLNDNWRRTTPIPAFLPHVVGSPDSKEEIIKAIRSIRIEVASSAQTTSIKLQKRLEYLKSELGMNIIVPEGRIDELRFKATLQGSDEGREKVVAVDGFPKGQIEEKHIVSGTIKLGINTLFKFVRVAGVPVGNLLAIELNPWDFSLGSIRRVNVAFSGGLTAQPEWYFRAKGIGNELRVALTIEKPKSLPKITAQVEARWTYRPPGLLKKHRVGTDKKSVDVYET